MPQKSHKKVKQEQKTKVKVKSFKTELPKGQNVTDTTFKVKKIQLKEQFAQHDESEIVSKRKLNVKELISRLKHHNAKMRSDALSGLREVVLTRGEEVLKSFLVPILEATALLAMDTESFVRQAAISLLGSVLCNVNENQLVPLLEPLTRYLACCMSHLDPDIRTDSLHLIDVLLTLPPEYAANHFVSTIFPRFLDMISSSAGESKRVLLLDLSVNTTSTLWRVGVLIRLQGLLQAIVQWRTAKSREVTDSANHIKSIQWSEEESVYAPLYHSTAGNYQKFEPLNLNKLPFQKRMELESNNFKYYADVLIPLLIDSFTEVSAAFKSSQKVFLISLEAAGLLSCITGIILALWDLLASSDSSGENISWFKTKYAEVISKKFIQGKFPYNIGYSDRTEESQKVFELFEKSKRSMDRSCVEQNLRLCHIAALMIPQSYPESMAKYLFNYLDEVESISKMKINVLVPCLKALVDAKKKKKHPLKGIDFPQLIEKVIVLYYNMKETEDSESTFRLLNLLAAVESDRQFKQIHRNERFSRWLGSLPELLCQDVICCKSLKIVSKIATHAVPGFLFGLETWIEAILDNLPNISVADEKDSVEEVKGIIAGFVYHIRQWDDDLIENVSKAVEKNYFGTSLSLYVKDLVEDRTGKSLPEVGPEPVIEEESNQIPADNETTNSIDEYSESELNYIFRDA